MSLRFLSKAAAGAGALIGVVLAAPAPAWGLTVKPAVTVTGDYVTLGDVLAGSPEGLGAAAQTIVAVAPAPGGRDSLAVTAVARAAAQAGLDGRALGTGHVSVARAGDAVPPALIEDKIEEALARRGADGSLQVRLTSLRGDIHVPRGTAPQTVRIEGLRHDARSGRFSATAVAPAGAGKSVRHELSGTARPVVHVPVLAHAVAAGEILSKRDIAWQALPARRVNRTMITALDDLVGMTPRRGLRPGTPLRQSDVERPLMVERGALVTMEVAHGPMSLSATGKAMQDGAMGAFIRLVNTATKRTVEAEIVGLNQVRVLTRNSLAQAR